MSDQTTTQNETVTVTDEEVNSLDAGSISFLKALRATDEDHLDTPALKDETGLGKDKVNYRFRKLDDLGFIEVGGGEKSDEGTLKPKRATLTERGCVALESLLEEDTETLHEQNERLNEMAKQVNRIERALADNNIDVDNY